MKHSLSALTLSGVLLLAGCAEGAPESSPPPPVATLSQKVIDELNERYGLASPATPTPNTHVYRDWGFSIYQKED